MDSGFPIVGGPAAWHGDLDWRQAGLVVLDAVQRDVVEAAWRGVREADLPDITQSSFPLLGMEGFFADLRARLMDGPGFVLIRGLDRARYSSDDLARIYTGFGAHLGHVVPQSGNGELLGHVMNIADLVDEDVRGYRTNQAMNMHSDGFDVVGLLCLRDARVGGASRICSAIAVHDRMAATRPDLLAVLYEGMRIRRMARDAERGNGYQVTPRAVPLFAPDGGGVSACVHVGQVRDAAANGAFAMSDVQREALDVLCALTASPEFYLEMDILPGDMQFLNNRLVLHGRAQFEDWPELERRRHLLRLWLMMPQWQARPQEAMDIFAPDDVAGWARHRTKLMELPERYCAQIRAGRAAIQRV